MNETSHVFEYIEDDKTYIFDTGSPFSIQAPGSQTKLGLDALVPGLFQDIAELIGKPVDGLLGMDVIRKHAWHFSSEHQRLTKQADGTVLSMAYPLDRKMGIPVVEVQIQGQTYRLWLDTGSSVTYFKKRLLPHDLPLSIKDYSPLLGWFESQGTRLDLSALGHVFETSVYEAPPLIESMMSDSIQGILGFGFMSKFDWILKENSMEIGVDL